MADLIPTRIVDKNGRTTTVHRKTSGAPKESALRGVKPVLNRQPAEQVHVIEGKTLHAASLSLKLLSHDEQKQYDLTRSTGDFKWRKSVEMQDSDLYEYLKMGVDSQDAAALHGLGIAADDLPNHPDLGVYVPGRLGRYDGQDSAYYIVPNRGVIDRFQAAGISAVEAEKAVANKVQDRFLNQSLDDTQLFQLFCKKKFTTPGDKRIRTNDRVTYSFIHGRLPMSVVDLSYKELREASEELTMMNDTAFKRVTADPELFEAVIRKVAQSSGNSRMIETLHKSVERHGRVVLEMDDPFLCALLSEQRGDNGITGGMDSVLYFDNVYKMIKESGRSHGDNYPHDWWGGYFTDGVSVKNSDLELLRKAGLTPQEAYDGLVLNKLAAEQLIVAHEDNLPQSLAGGAL